MTKTISRARTAEEFRTEVLRKLRNDIGRFQKREETTESTDDMVMLIVTQSVLKVLFEHFCDVRFVANEIRPDHPRGSPRGSRPDWVPAESRTPFNPDP